MMRETEFGLSAKFKLFKYFSLYRRSTRFERSSSSFNLAVPSLHENYFEICNITLNNGIYLFVFEIDVTQRADAGCLFYKKYSIVFILNSKKVMKHPTSETVTIDWYSLRLKILKSNF